MKTSKQLVLIDGSGYIFRAYYALPNMYRTDGTPVNAVFGFCNMLLKLLEDFQKEKGGNVGFAVIFDAARRTFRNDIYKDYKANRGEPPEDLIPQFQIIKDSVKAFGIQSIELSGFEADDIIATYARIGNGCLQQGETAVAGRASRSGLTPGKNCIFSGSGSFNVKNYRGLKPW